MDPPSVSRINYTCLLPYAAGSTFFAMTKAASAYGVVLAFVVLAVASLMLGAQGESGELRLVNAAADALGKRALDLAGKAARQRVRRNAVGNLDRGHVRGKPRQVRVAQPFEDALGDNGLQVDEHGLPQQSRVDLHLGAAFASRHVSPPR